MKIQTEENEIEEHSSYGLHTNKQPNRTRERKKNNLLAMADAWLG